MCCQSHAQLHSCSFEIRLVVLITPTCKLLLVAIIARAWVNGEKQRTAGNVRVYTSLFESRLAFIIRVHQHESCSRCRRTRHRGITLMSNTFVVIISHYNNESPKTVLCRVLNTDARRPPQPEHVTFPHLPSKAIPFRSPIRFRYVDRLSMNQPRPRPVRPNSTISVCKNHIGLSNVYDLSH